MLVALGLLAFAAALVLGVQIAQRRQDRWQAIPPGAAALLVGLPLGIAVGRLGFSAFARSAAVVEDPVSPLWLVGLLGLAGDGRRRRRG